MQTCCINKHAHWASMFIYKSCLNIISNRHVCKQCKVSFDMLRTSIAIFFSSNRRKYRNIDSQKRQYALTISFLSGKTNKKTTLKAAKRREAELKETRLHFVNLVTLKKSTSSKYAGTRIYCNDKVKRAERKAEGVAPYVSKSVEMKGGNEWERGIRMTSEWEGRY